MKIIFRVIMAFAAGCMFLAGQASADVVFEETTSQSGSSMGGGTGGKTKVLISGDKYRAQKKLTMDEDAMADQMKFQQQMGGVNQGVTNKINRAGMPAYPDHVMTLDEWAGFDQNTQMIDEAGKSKGGGLGGALGLKKSPIGGLLGKKKAEAPKTTLDDVLHKYCNEADAGLMMKKQDEAAAKQAAEGGMGFLSLAQVADYDTWLRLKIIRDACPGSEDMRKQEAALNEGGFGGGGSKKIATFAEMQKISDDSSAEYKDLKRRYDLKSEYKAEYAKAKEKGKGLAAATGDRMKEGMKAMGEEMGDMLLNVQIIRLDTGKVFEIFPPKKAKDPKPEDVTYKEESVDDVRGRISEVNETKQKGLKANEGRMKEAEAQKAAAMAKYGNQPAFAKPEAKKIGDETVNGIPCEHWKLTAGRTEDDYWVSSKFPGYAEIMAFEAKLKAKVGAGRDGLSFGSASGGMPDMGALMSGLNPDKDAEIARIKARGLVIKHVNTMKNAGTSQANMLANQKAAAGDMGDAGAAQKMQAMEAMKSMTPAQKAAMMKDPAMMQQMMGGQAMGAAAQQSVEKRQASGEMKFGGQDMSSTYELKIIGAGPVPAAAFEPPPGARKK